MTISEFIKELEQKKSQHGDLEIIIEDEELATYPSVVVQFDVFDGTGRFLIF